MKKMRNKKGFTLAEVLIVVAIIVILSGATAVGVVSWLKSAQNTKNEILKKNGDNFENEARLAVETAKGDAPVGVGESVTVNPVVTTTEGTTTVKQQEETTTVKQQEGTTTVKQQEETTTVKQQEETTTVKQQNNSTVTVSKSNSTLVTRGSNIAGVCSYTISGNTITAQLYAGNNSNSDSAVTSITITKQSNGNFLVDFSGVASGDYWICQDKVGFTADNYWGGQKTKVVTASELKSGLGLDVS